MQAGGMIFVCASNGSQRVPCTESESAKQARGQKNCKLLYESWISCEDLTYMGNY